MGGWAIPLLGTGAALAGLLLLRRAWREGPVASGPGRYAVAGGWALVGAGLALFAAAGRPVWGLSVAALVVMGLVLPIVLAPVFAPGWAPRPPRIETREPPGRPAGFAARTAARAAGSLLAAPALGLAAALAWRAAGPGGPADKLLGAAFAAPLTLAAALVAILAARRPWRVSAIVTAAALACAGLAFAARLTGA